MNTQLGQGIRTLSCGHGEHSSLVRTVLYMGNGGAFSQEDLGLLVLVVGPVTNPVENEGREFGVWVHSHPSCISTVLC